MMQMIVFVDDDLSFVHNVSGLKPYGVNQEYFNCVLQSPTSARKAVCFSPKKHKLMNDVAESHSPVKITKVKTDINSNDIVVKNESEIIAAEASSSFLPDKRLSKEAINSITDLFSLAPRQSVSLLDLL